VLRRRRRARRGRAQAKAEVPAEGRRKEEKRRKEKKERKKREKENEKNGEKENRKRKIEKGRDKGFRKLGEILGKLGGRGKRDFAGFSGFGRQHDFRDGCDGEADWPAGLRRAGDSGVVADRGAGAARDGRRPECRRCQRDSRHARRG
jgi:hypothetical protein